MSRRGDDYHRCPTCNTPMTLVGYDKYGPMYHCEMCNANSWTVHLPFSRDPMPDPPLSDVWAEYIDTLDIDDSPAR